MKTDLNAEFIHLHAVLERELEGRPYILVYKTTNREQPTALLNSGGVSKDAVVSILRTMATNLEQNDFDPSYGGVFTN
jgi:hypothetical protein